MKDIIGIIASILIVFSMVFKTTTFKGTMCMRVINTVGSAFFIAYGFWPNAAGFLGVNAFATGLANSLLFVLNIFYIFKESFDCKKEKKNESNC